MAVPDDLLLSFYRKSGSHLPSRETSLQVFSAVWVFTVVFGMGTGVSPLRIATGHPIYSLHLLPKLETVNTQTPTSLS